MSDWDSGNAGTGAGFRQLLNYFSLVRQQPLKPIPHPDRDVNELIRGQEDSLRRASVLIPVTRHSAGRRSQVVLTVRSENLRNHAGQISFPGGSSEPGDLDTAATALRETEEEIGVNPAEVEVLGILGDMALPTGFLITPVVGLIEPGLEFTPCPEEVADVFQIPLSLILDPRAYRASTWEYQARNCRVLELYYEDYRIWGATAAMLFHLASEVSTVGRLDSI